MRPFTLLPVVSTLLFARVTVALTETYTLPFEDGNTLLLSVGTNAAGLAVTQTLSTLTPADPDALTTPTATLTSTTSSTTSTTTKKTTTPAVKVPPGGPGDTTTQRVVGQDTTAPPMKTTTYWFDPGDGTWTYGVWTASVTAAPTVTTANVPAGTIQPYDQYQTTVNSVVLASAEAAASSASAGNNAGSKAVTGGARRIMDREAGALGGWTAVFVGVVGAAIGVHGL